jgi:hypothetical protein
MNHRNLYKILNLKIKEKQILIATHSAESSSCIIPNLFPSVSVNM